MYIRFFQYVDTDFNVAVNFITDVWHPHHLLHLNLDYILMTNKWFFKVSNFLVIISFILFAKILYDTWNVGTQQKDEHKQRSHWEPCLLTPDKYYLNWLRNLTQLQISVRTWPCSYANVSMTTIWTYTYVPLLFGWGWHLDLLWCPSPEL